MTKRPSTSIQETVATTTKGNNRAQFVLKLHEAINKFIGDFRNIVYWNLAGTAFIVQKPDLFETIVLPTFCEAKSFSSFERQLHFYSVSNTSIIFLCSKRSQTPSPSTLINLYFLFLPLANYCLFKKFKRMGVLENEPSGKRFRKGSPKKYQHPNFKKNLTQQELQSILRTTFPNGNKVVGKKKDQVKSKRQSSYDKKQLLLLRYKNIVRALEEEIRLKTQKEPEELELQNLSYAPQKNKPAKRRKRNSVMSTCSKPTAQQSQLARLYMPAVSAAAISSSSSTPPSEVYASSSSSSSSMKRRRDPPPRSYLDGHPGKQIIVYQQQQEEERRDATKRPSLPSPSLEAAKTTFEPLHTLNRHGSNLNNFTADVDEMDFDTMIKQINDAQAEIPSMEDMTDFYFDSGFLADNNFS